ncbi:MAG: ornithine cyclodeaminase family protein [Gemmatimonadales bacterium]
MPRPSTLLLTGRDVDSLLDLDGCIAAVEAAFGAHGRGECAAPGVLGIHASEGGFHIKAGLLRVEGGEFFVAKSNSNFRHNPARHGLPTIQGVVVLCDAQDGRLLALIDSMEITTLRTGAATAVAAMYLARSDAAVATIAGCGNQGRVQLRALARVRPLRAAFAVDRDADGARRFAAAMTRELHFPVEAAGDLAGAVARSDLVVTCTPSTEPLLARDTIRPGTFVAGVGADSEDKWELAPDLLAGSTLVVDLLEQAATIGDLHHALAAGILTRDAVHAELGQVVAGLRPGRTSDAEVTVFDSTGMALQDAAAAAAVYVRALHSGSGVTVELGPGTGSSPAFSDAEVNDAMDHA